MFDQNVGKHCSLETCNQKDWLPVKCKYCQKTFCADHSSIDSHNCPKYEKEYKKVYVCPLCNKTLSMNNHLTVEENFSIHEAMDCAGDYAAHVPIVIKCAGSRCKTKLNDLNTFSCQVCRSKVCLKHRMPEDHMCRVK